MGRNRCRMRESNPVIDVLHDEPGALRHILALFARVTHAPVEADTIAVNPIIRFVQRLPDFTIGALALLRIPKTNLSVHHDAAACYRLALVFGFAENSLGFEKGRSANSNGLRHGAALLHESRGVGQRTFRED